MYFYSSENQRPVFKLPETFNLVNFSHYRQLDCQVPFRNFAIKYVAQGDETYSVNGSRYSIQSGEYLLANQHAEGRILIDSTEQVSGICIELMPDLIADVVASCRRPDTAIPDREIGAFFSSEWYPENRYSSDRTNLGKMLRRLNADLSSNPIEHRSFSMDFFYTLAEHLIYDHIHTHKQLQNLGELKPATGRELYKKVVLGKNIIDDNVSQRIEVCEIAAFCCMSEYHFFRVFKKVFGISPYQYHLQLRLNRAHALLMESGSSVKVIAEISGFADLSSFSKAFRKVFGYPPSKISQID